MDFFWDSRIEERFAALFQFLVLALSRLFRFRRFESNKQNQTIKTYILCEVLSQRYFPKWQLPKCAISQVFPSHTARSLLGNRSLLGKISKFKNYYETPNFELNVNFLELVCKHGQGNQL